MFERYDALLLPTAPFCPTLAEVRGRPDRPEQPLGTFTNFVNLCDLAGFAVPVGFGPTACRSAAMLLGPAWSEGRLAALADALHRAFADHGRRTAQSLPPPAAPDPWRADETALFCIGAHMCGLPLNHQLTALGGRFLRRSHDPPAYRLYALGNRPGMVRAATVRRSPARSGRCRPRDRRTAGAGAAAAGLRHRDAGRWPCLGFLAESAGVAGARDITQLWRLASLHHGGDRTVRGRTESTRIAALIYCGREGEGTRSGRRADAAKKICNAARLQLKMRKMVFPRPFVKVKADWRESHAFVEELDWRRQLGNWLHPKGFNTC